MLKVSYTHPGNRCDVYEATAVTGRLARLLAASAPPDMPQLSDRAEEGMTGDLAFDSLTVLVRGVDSLRTASDLGAELRHRLAVFADAAEISRERAIRWAQLRAAMSAVRGPSVDDASWEKQFCQRTAELLAE